MLCSETAKKNDRFFDTLLWEKGMKNKGILNQVSIRDFLGLKALMDKQRIEKQKRNTVIPNNILNIDSYTAYFFNTQSHPEFILRFLKETAKQQDKSTKESLIEMQNQVQHDRGVVGLKWGRCLQRILKQVQHNYHPYKKISFSESGRSMVEILGVLAVVGVLSVGGMKGYRFAMDKYRANDIVNEVNLRNRDTWNQYQTKDLPETDKLEEWSDRTQTGFPINVYPRSNIVFDVQVDEVPSGVCQQVLNMNIVGPMFIWTFRGESEKIIYDGSNASTVCQETEENVSIVFTTSLESYGLEQGLRNDITDENGRPIRYCIDAGDCISGCETCDDRTYQCLSICGTSAPICTETVGCVQCEQNADCGKGKICNETSNQCETLPAQCEEGISYRSENGACISCSNQSVVKVSNEKFSKPEMNIEDEKTGVEQCGACEGHQAVPDESDELNPKFYCSTGCVKNINYEDINGACIPCTDKEQHYIPANPTGKSMCEACGLTWIRNWAGNRVVCSAKPECKKNEILIMTMGSYSNFKWSCIPCSDSNSWSMYGWLYGGPISNYDSDLKSYMQNQCQACEEPDKRYVEVRSGEYYCTRVCKENEFQSYGGTCYPCNGNRYSLNSGYSMTQTQCEICDNYMFVLDGNTSSCVPIDPGTTGICNSLDREFVSDSGKLSATAQAYLNGEHDGESFRDTNGQCHACDAKGSFFTTAAQCGMCPDRIYDAAGQCSMSTCQEGLFKNKNQKCISCNEYDINYISDTYSVKKAGDCSCENWMVLQTADQLYCMPKNKCSVGEFVSIDGICKECHLNQAVEIGTDSDSKSKCEDCNNRVAYSITGGKMYCSVIAIPNETFVNSEGNLVNCNDSSDVVIIPDSSNAQTLCNQCSGRQYENGNCIKK